MIDHIKSKNKNYTSYYLDYYILTWSLVQLYKIFQHWIKALLLGSWTSMNNNEKKKTTYDDAACFVFLCFFNIFINLFPQSDKTKNSTVWWYRKLLLRHSGWVAMIFRCPKSTLVWSRSHYLFECFVGSTAVFVVVVVVFVFCFCFRFFFVFFCFFFCFLLFPFHGGISMCTKL